MIYQRGYTSLMEAAWNGHGPVVEYLVHRGADMEATDRVSDAIMDVLTHMHILLVTQCFSVDILH